MATAAPRAPSVEAGDHARRAPELDVVGVVLGLLGPSLPLRVPGCDAVVEARANLRPEPPQPRRVAADAPLAVHLHDPAELAVGRRVEVVRRRLDRQGDPEILVAALVLADVELGLPQRALQRREQVGDRLGVVPDVGARPGPCALSSSQPSQPHSRPSAWRRTVGDFRMHQVRRDRLDGLRGQRCCRRSRSRSARCAAQVHVAVGPVAPSRASMLAKRPHTRACSSRWRPPCRAAGRASPSAGSSGVPGEAHPDRLRRPGDQVKGDEERGARGGAALARERPVVGQRPARRRARPSSPVEPAAAEPGEVHLRRRDRRPPPRTRPPPCSVAGQPPPYRMKPPGTASRRARLRASRLHSSGCAGTKLRALNENTASISSCPLWVNVYSRPGDGQARVVGVARLERAPAGDPRRDRQGGVLKLDPREREVRAEGGGAEAGQSGPHRRVPLEACRLARRASTWAPGPRRRARSSRVRRARSPRGARARSAPRAGAGSRRSSGRPFRTRQIMPGADAPQGEGDLLEVLALVNEVGAPRAGGFRLHRGRLRRLRRKGGPGCDGSKRGD
jgi:hypothetical protein